MTPLHEAHKYNNLTSKRATQLLHKHLKQTDSLHWLTVYPPVALPYKPLVGIITPACGIEMGIPSATSWKALVPDLARALCATMVHLYDGTYET
jgi:hypothetical protein